MTPHHVKVTVHTRDAQRLLKKIVHRMRGYEKAFEHGRLWLQVANAGNFGSRGVPVGGWAVYGNWSAQKGQPASLVRTGNLMESLTNLTGAPNVIGSHRATFGTNIEYARFHQYGTTKMPSRPVVFDPSGFKSHIVRAIENQLDVEVSLSSLKASLK
jgi:phage gpG-like protein